MIISSDILSFEEWQSDRCYLRMRLDTSIDATDLSPSTIACLCAGRCGYSAALTEVSQRYQDVRDNGAGYDWRQGWVDISVSLCPLCGYWHEHEVSSFGERGTEEARLSLLRRFDVGDLSVPLESESQKNPLSWKDATTANSSSSR